MSTLNLNDLFWTFQGEGFNAGRRSLFVRLPYCNLRCSWCDTEFNYFKRYSENDFQSIINQELSPFAVLTGGEPLMNPQIETVIQFLKDRNFLIACETNGTQSYVDGIDWVTCSPKQDSKWMVHEDLVPKVSEYKYVVDSDFDFSILDRHDNDHVAKYLSPEFNDMNTNVNKIIEYIKGHPKWSLSLQTHKWIGIP